MNDIYEKMKTVLQPQTNLHHSTQHVLPHLIAKRLYPSEGHPDCGGVARPWLLHVPVQLNGHLVSLFRHTLHGSLGLVNTLTHHLNRNTT